jgi:hypothetical protein
MDRLQVDADAGQQLIVAGLGAREHALVDQPVDLGPGGLQVQAVGDQHPGRQVVALQQQAEQEVLGAEVVVAQPPRLHPGQPGGMAGRPGGVHPPWDRLHGGLPPLPGATAGAVFLVDGLLGDAEAAGDVLPGPAGGAGVVDLQGLQHLEQAT